jgi:ABC-2 type transport system ATP-binding protein
MSESKPAIHVSGLTKIYKVPEREGGLSAALKSLVNRRYKEVKAVDHIAFDVAHGEVVGFLGPNGAGKTTTLKMLSGLLYPSDGTVTVLGSIPSKREKDYLRQITLIMGQRNQLVWDIPAIDSFDLNRAIYRIPTAEYVRTRDELIALLEIGDLVKKPVRNLSLGERMKVEFCAALLHLPKVLYLDEPTIGLDVTMQRRIRQFIAEYNARYDATVLLTSHYMADVEALCKRVIVIHHGKLLFDGDLSTLVDRFSSLKTIALKLDSGEENLEKYGEVVDRQPGSAVLRVHRSDIARITAQLLNDLDISDLTVEDPPIEDVIEDVFATKAEEVAEVPA